jgi:hypothetical protein
MASKPLTPAEKGALRPALEPVLSFASLWDERTTITSTAQVQELMFKAAVALGARVVQVIEPEKFSAYIDDQKVLRGWLKDLLRFDKLTPAKRSELLHEVAAWADTALVRIRPAVVDGVLRRVEVLEATGVRAIVGDVMSRLLNHDAEGANLIGVCKHCQSYFFKARSHKVTCSDSCRVLKSRGN